MALPTVKLDQGIHVMHLFYTVDRVAWEELARNESREAKQKLQTLCEANNHACQPFLRSYATVSGKADLCFWLMHEELGALAQMHRDLEECFPPGTIDPVYSYLSVTELSEYQPTDDDSKSSPINPEMQGWEVMAFYPINVRHSNSERPTSKYARVVGRKYADRISQMITVSTGLDDWEWGVTLMAHQLDALKEIVSEMRFDEVSARYADFGQFYINLRAQPEDLWEHLHL